MRTTIVDIQCANKKAGHHFFDPETLKFFGQRIRDFAVRHVGQRVFIFAPRFPAGREKKMYGYTVAEFNKATGTLDSMPGFMFDTMGTIEGFFECVALQER